MTQAALRSASVSLRVNIIAGDVSDVQPEILRRVFANIDTVSASRHCITLTINRTNPPSAEIVMLVLAHEIGHLNMHGSIHWDEVRAWKFALTHCEYPSSEGWLYIEGALRTYGLGTKIAELREFVRDREADATLQA